MSNNSPKDPLFSLLIRGRKEAFRSELLHLFVCDFLFHQVQFQGALKIKYFRSLMTVPTVCLPICVFTACITWSVIAVYLTIFLTLFRIPFVGGFGHSPNVPSTLSSATFEMSDPSTDTYMLYEWGASFEHGIPVSCNGRRILKN